MKQTSISKFFGNKSDATVLKDGTDPIGSLLSEVTEADAKRLMRFVPSTPATSVLSSNVTQASKITPVVDRPQSYDEQEFINFFLSKAVSPLIRGQPLKTRQVAVFGEKYYWGVDATFPINALPLSFRQWCVTNKYTGFNSVLVNVYQDKSSNIGWHMDATKPMAKGDVVSISFAAYPEHRNKTLAMFEFRWPDKKIPTKKKTSAVLLDHGTAIRFDAIKHEKKKCEHRVARTLYPRVNVTLRRIKKNTV